MPIRARLTKPLKLFKKALQINPRLPEAKYNLAVMYLQKKDYVSAIKLSDEAAKLGVEQEQDFLESLKPFRK